MGLMIALLVMLVAALNTQLPSAERRVKKTRGVTVETRSA
jgi:hypothetical protein